MKNSRSRSAVLALVVGFLVANLAYSQQISPSMYSEMRWRMIGPFRGGRVLGVAGVPENPSVYYFGSSGGGVWKTTDAGTVWQPIFDAADVASIGALAIAPSNPNVLYVGTGENSLYGDLAYGDGMYKSQDGGQTWEHVGLENTRRVSKILIDPQNPDVVLVAAMGRPYGPNDERGVFRTTDGGRTWTKVLYKDQFTSAADLSFDPDNPKVVYATLWNGIRVPGRHQTFNGPGGGIYRSSDGGLRWTQLNGHGLPADKIWGRSGVAAASGGRVYAIIDAIEDGGFFRSDDGGANWTRATSDPRIKGVWFFGQVFIDPQNRDTVYLPVTNLFRSTDGGHTWTSIKGAPGGDDYHTLWIDPQNSRRMIVGSDQGATISVDYGKSWSSWYNQPTGQFYRAATDHRYPYFVYGPQQDSGTAAVASRSDYGQIGERDWFPVGPGESGYTIPDAADPDCVYNAGPSGSVVRFFRVTGQVQNVSPAPISLGTKYRFNWIIPLAFSPQEPHVLYLGTQFLLKTTNQGMSWQPISPDLTRPAADDTANPLNQSDAEGPIKRGLGTLLTIAPSPVQPGVIWTGSDDGYIQLTRDGGAHWRNVTPGGMGPWSEVKMIEASHFNSGTAYVAVDRNNLDDLKPYIYRTHDYGQAWRQVSDGINAMDSVHVVREDPVRRGLLYAGTERRVYVSFDDGDHWQPLQLNMPVAAVHDLAIEQGDLVAATYGRSFWILDDLEPLRQAPPDVAAPYLFVPRTAIRSRRDVNQDTPLPPEVPAGKNPPHGAILDYYLPAQPSGEITLEIRDEGGELIRSYSSLPAEETKGPEPYIPEYWLAHPLVLSKQPGTHRIAWDLRYTPPEALRKPTPYSYPMGAIMGQTPTIPQGALAVPGKYNVTLRVDGRRYSQPLEVKMDPRVKVTREALTRQLDLQLEISTALATNFAAAKQLAGLREKLTELAKVAGPLGASATTLDRNATNFEGEAGAPQEPPKAIGFNILDETLTQLMELVGGADLAPTQQSFFAFQDSCKSLNSVLTAWQAFKSNEVKAFNHLLRDQGRQALPEYPAVAKDVSCSK